MKRASPNTTTRFRRVELGRLGIEQSSKLDSTKAAEHGAALQRTRQPGRVIHGYSSRLLQRPSAPAS
ncbi:hypothetical protein G6F68_012911 [Rhizopus microsporus]|nr:hypothetical protein G6F68_012911 [Rhizopus microsporus]